MIFTDLRFVVLLACCWATFFLLPERHRPLALAGWGAVFYGVFAGPYLPLVLGLIAATFVVTKGRAAWGWVLVGLVLLLLVGFKSGFDPAWPRPGRAKTAGAVPLLIPLGFSFLAFELIHFVIERRKGRIGESGLVEIAAFALFFPCRVAGPIKRYPQFMEAVRSAAPSFENLYRGVVRILLGLFKKVVLADVLALTAPELSHATSPAHAWRVVLVYGLQIYLDFSAYSDLAIGTSRLLGIVVPENFQRPYLSPSIQDFWNRWHISLSSWARDYLFMPIGRGLFMSRLRRSTTLIAASSYLLTFLVIGAWHGLAPNFLVWGGYHGVLLTGHYVWRTRLPAAVAASAIYQSRAARVAGGVVTFLLVTVGWVPFMTDLPHALVAWKVMFGVS